MPPTRCARRRVPTVEYVSPTRPFAHDLRPCRNLYDSAVVVICDAHSQLGVHLGFEHRVGGGEHPGDVAEAKDKCTYLLLVV